jgi:hypothetical protein
MLLHDSERLHETDFQMLGRSHRREALADEVAEFLMDGHALFTVVTELQVGFELENFSLAEGTVEKEVHHAFIFVTKHCCSFLPKWA